MLYHPHYEAIGFHFDALESALHYRWDRNRSLYVAHGTIKRMIDYMKPFNYFFVCFRAKDYAKGLLEMQQALEGIGKLKVFFYRSYERSFKYYFAHRSGFKPSRKRPFALYCKIKFNGDVWTAEKLQKYFQKDFRSLRIQRLVFPFDISKTLITFIFNGCFKK